ncbi:MAG: aminodeoxychorismate synthase component I [Gammaproteobacteria bacterium]|nr:aminodeoxychorismate synthase component I [Gammaproteobacteria bacterium]
MSRLTEIPYREDSAPLFEALVDRAWPVFLDSGRPRITSGRYDVLAADPYATLVTRGGVTEIRDADGVTLSPADPFELLAQHLAPSGDSVGGLPFSGGALGWFAYDLGRRIETLPSRAVDGEHIPDMAVGLYDWALVVDHQERRSWLVGQGRDPRTAASWSDLSAMFRVPPVAARRPDLRLTGPLASNMSRHQYGTAFARIQDYIRAGDCYQVNLAQRFAAPARGHAWPAYRRLRALNPAPFAAYMGTPYGEVLSSSPERFLSLREGRVESRPIKGTRPRGGGPEADAALARELAISPKDRAENLMIVDLLRNDLGRVCRPGSVRVPGLFEVESYATVHHLVSTVTGELAAGHDATTLLRACFPGGSITGAPKIRAMEIIEELEPQRRGVYCGSVGYIGFDGAMDTNIAIRTLVYNRDTIRLWAGGGIVHDSTMAAEYQETLDKAAALLRLLEPDEMAHVGG